LSSFRIFLAIFILTGINILNVIEFRKRYSSSLHRIHENSLERSTNTIIISTNVLKQKQKSTKNENNKKASRNITLMIVFQCFLYTFGN
jgi:hypothetical protein